MAEGVACFGAPPLTWLCLRQSFVVWGNPSLDRQPNIGQYVHEAVEEIEGPGFSYGEGPGMKLDQRIH